MAPPIFLFLLLFFFSFSVSSLQSPVVGARQLLWTALELLGAARHTRQCGRTLKFVLRPLPSTPTPPEGPQNVTRAISVSVTVTIS